MMENFSEELFAKIKSIQALLKGAADPCASKLNLGADVDLATLAVQDVFTLTQKIEKIKNDVNLLDFTASLNRSNSINEEKNTPSEEQISPLLTDQDQKLEQTKLGEDGEAVKDWKDLRRFVVISEKGNYQHGIKRTYRCTICGFLETNSASQMQDHVETAHFKGAFKYNCPFCERQFQSRCTFKRHKRKVHKVKQELDEVSTNTESETIQTRRHQPKLCESLEWFQEVYSCQREREIRKTWEKVHPLVFHLWPHKRPEKPLDEPHREGALQRHICVQMSCLWKFTNHQACSWMSHERKAKQEQKRLEWIGCCKNKLCVKVWIKKSNLSETL